MTTLDPGTPAVQPPTGGDAATEAPEERPIDADTAELVAALAESSLTDERVRESVLRAIGVQLQASVLPTTAARLVTSVRSLTDPEVPSLLLSFVSRCWEDSTLLEDFEQCRPDPDVSLWVRELIATYGQPIRIANLVDGQDLDGWREVTRTVYYDETESRWMVGLRVTKNDGSTITLTDEVTNMLLLSQIVIVAAGTLPPESLASEPMTSRMQQILDVANPLLNPPDEASIPPQVEAAQVDVAEATTLR